MLNDFIVFEVGVEILWKSLLCSTLRRFIYVYYKANALLFLLVTSYIKKKQKQQ